jgi:hypothetical protein
MFIYNPIFQLVLLHLFMTHLTMVHTAFIIATPCSSSVEMLPACYREIVAWNIMWCHWWDKRQWDGYFL